MPKLRQDVAPGYARIVCASVTECRVDKMENKTPEVADLQAANQELQDSLDRCHELVAEYRSKLAANVNTPEASDSFLDDRERG